MKFFIIILLSNIIHKILNQECSDYTDCFNCTSDIYCQWKNNTCDIYSGNNTLPKINETFQITNYTILYNHFLFIKDTCFNKSIPFVPTSEYTYNEISEYFCGERIIKIDSKALNEGFFVELNNISNIYGAKNLLCEYIVVTGASRYNFEVYINKSLTDDFFLLFRDDIEPRIVVVNSTRILILNNPGSKAFSFLYYGYRSFETPPFKIHYKNEILPKDNTNYILGVTLVTLIAVGITTLMIVVIYIRHKSKTLRPDIKGYNCDISMKDESEGKNKNSKKSQNKKNLSVIEENRNESAFGNQVENENDNKFIGNSSQNKEKKENLKKEILG